MKTNIKKFIYKIVILEAIITFLTLLLNLFFKEYYLPIYPIVILFFGIISFVVHYVLLKASERRANYFINNFMVSSISKMLIYLVFVGTYLFFEKENQATFIIFFMTNYFIFSIFEIKTLLDDLRKNDENKIIKN